ncbi:hypothetical protein [Marimonas lutisalis]|uniref:hypothetical protein n=1 Tax=Marimonas lutisalis TaxID=2545756 RepID=UPI0010F926CE|nr:hypothetical protein [Marimonas lutisalis]
MNYFAFGFVGVVAVVGLGVDYQQQSAKSGLPLGQMSLEQYVDTYEARFLGAKAEKEAEKRERDRQVAWKQGGIQYLPEAPEGWTRRKYSEGDNTPIMFEGNVYYEMLAKNGGAKSLAENFKAKSAAEAAAETDKHSYVYERGNEAVFVSVNTKNKVNDDAFGSMIGLAMGGLNRANPNAVLGYHVVGGVGFVELPVAASFMEQMAAMKDEDYKPSHGFNRAHFRRLVGSVGFNQEVSVTVHANASTDSTLEVLSAIDWDGLNNMLSTPMALVGNDVVLPADMEHEKIAKAQFALRAEFNDLRSKVADFKLRNTNDAALVMNLYSKGSVDVTGGQVPDLSALVEAAFRKEMRDLMAGRPSTNEYERILSMIEERPEEERDTPEGEMSEELKKELYGYNADQPVENGLPATREASATPETGGAASDPTRMIVGIDKAQLEAWRADPTNGFKELLAHVAEIERSQGLNPGACRPVKNRPQITCDLTNRKAASAEPEKSGGFMGALSGLLGGGGAKPKAETRGEAQVVVRNGQGKAGVGTKAGNCSYEGAIKRCSIGN